MRQRAAHKLHLNVKRTPDCPFPGHRLGWQAEPRHVRRTALSTVSYLLRWQHRPTPLGLFAGTAPVSVGPRASVRWRDKHRAVIRLDAEWVTEPGRAWCWGKFDGDGTQDNHLSPAKLWSVREL